MTGEQGAPGLPTWDEGTRPRGPGYPGATRAELARGEHLRQVHDLYRQGLAQVGEVLEQVRAGRLELGDARAAVHALGVRVGLDQLGTFCAQLCRSIETHHMIEDHHLYPALRAADDHLAPVLDRLDLEHRVVHEVLQRLDAALVSLARSGERGLPEVFAGFDHLRTLLESHFRYEEEQIGTALAVHGVVV